MDKVVVRERTGTALASLLAASAMLAIFGGGGFALIRARDPSGDLAPWWLMLLTLVVCGFYVLLSAMTLVMSLSALADVPRAILDDYGIRLRGLGVVEWADVREVKLVLPRRGSDRLKLALERWEKYASRQPTWMKRVERWLPRRQAVVLYLAGTDADPAALCTLMREQAARHRRPAA